MNNLVNILCRDSEWVEQFTALLKKESTPFQICDSVDQVISGLSKTGRNIIVSEWIEQEENKYPLLSKLNQLDVDTRCIIVRGNTKYESAFKALKKHAFDYFPKGTQMASVFRSVRAAIGSGRTKTAPAETNLQLVSDIGMLTDIGKLMYQVDDKELAMDMILDTLAEGFGIRQSAIFILNQDENLFSIQKSKALSEDFVSSFAFSSGDKINHIEISNNSFTVVPAEQGKLAVGSKQLAISDKEVACIFVPLFYKEQHFGFIMSLADEKQKYAPEVSVQLIKLMGVQSAPVFHHLFVDTKPRVKFGKRAFDQLIMELIEENLDRARSMGSPVAFCFARITILDHINDSWKLNNTISTYRDILSDNLGTDYQLIWQTLDTAMIILPGADLFATESILMDLRQKIEGLNTDNSENLSLTLKYSYACHPQAGNSVKDIINLLWTRLFEEMEKPEDKSVKTAEMR